MKKGQTPGFGRVRGTCELASPQRRVSRDGLRFQLPGDQPAPPVGSVWSGCRLASSAGGRLRPGTVQPRGGATLAAAVAHLSPLDGLASSCAAGPPATWSLPPSGRQRSKGQPPRGGESKTKRELVKRSFQTWAQNLGRSTKYRDSHGRRDKDLSSGHLPAMGNARLWAATKDRIRFSCLHAL